MRIAPIMDVESLPGGHTKVTMVSSLSGKEHSMDLPVTIGQLQDWERQGLKIQDAFPTLTLAQREFLLTGSTQDEWDAAFKDAENGQ